jgi:hypothetical protein
MDEDKNQENGDDLIGQQVGRANRRPASPLNAGRQSDSASCAPPFLSAAVAHLWRWAAVRRSNSKPKPQTNMKYSKTITLSALVLLYNSLTLVSGASPTTYSDRSDFLTASGATNATGPLPSRAPFADQTIILGNVTVTQVSSDHAGVISNLTPRLPGNVLSVNYEDLDFLLPSPVFSFGFDFVEPEFDPFVNAPFIDSTFSVTLKDGASVIGSFTFNAPNDTVAFVGVLSDTPFDRVEVRELVGSHDNEFFGKMYAGGLPPPRLSIRVSQIELCWDSISNTVYQLHYRSSLTTNVWLPLGGTFLGDGSRLCTNDAILSGEPQKYYRLFITNAP